MLQGGHHDLIKLDIYFLSQAPLNAQLHGGELKWTGSGVWEPSSICVDWYSSNMAWTCETNKASATSWSLVNCRERTPRQKCAEFFG